MQRSYALTPVENQSTITIAPAFDRAGNRLYGRFDARLGDRLLVARTRQPLLDAARELIALGFDPYATVVMKRLRSDTECLLGRIGDAAKLMVEESAHGPVLRSIRKTPPGAVDRPPIARIGPTQVEGRERTRDGAGAGSVR
jgi:hypothetical protein